MPSIAWIIFSCHYSLKAQTKSSLTGAEIKFSIFFYKDIAFKLFVFCYTGCPKSSFLYFMSLYFITIGVGKQIIQSKVVSFNLIHYFYTCCAIFWLEYSICILPRKWFACSSIFSSHIFLYFIAQIARTPSFFFCKYHER